MITPRAVFAFSIPIFVVYAVVYKSPVFFSNVSWSLPSTIKFFVSAVTSVRSKVLLVQQGPQSAFVSFLCHHWWSWCQDLWRVLALLPARHRLQTPGWAGQYAGTYSSCWLVNVRAGCSSTLILDYQRLPVPGKKKHTHALYKCWSIGDFFLSLLPQQSTFTCDDIFSCFVLFLSGGDWPLNWLGCLYCVAKVILVQFFLLPGQQKNSILNFTPHWHALSEFFFPLGLTNGQ